MTKHKTQGDIIILFDWFSAFCVNVCDSKCLCCNMTFDQFSSVHFLFPISLWSLLPSTYMAWITKQNFWPRGCGCHIPLFNQFLGVMESWSCPNGQVEKCLSKIFMFGYWIVKTTNMFLFMFWTYFWKYTNSNFPISPAPKTTSKNVAEKLSHGFFSTYYSPFIIKKYSKNPIWWILEKLAQVAYVGSE